MTDMAALAAAVELLGSDLVENGRRLAENGHRIDKQNILLAEQNKALAGFVPKGRFRWAIAIVAAVLTIAIVAFVIVRIGDQSAERERVRQDRQEALRDRERLYAGCVRGNDLRATLRGVIDRAYSAGALPLPDGLSPELVELYHQAQARSAAQREAQLADPGVQPVDCDDAYPPLPRE